MTCGGKRECNPTKGCNPRNFIPSDRIYSGRSQREHSAKRFAEVGRLAEITSPNVRPLFFAKNATTILFAPPPCLPLPAPSSPVFAAAARTCVADACFLFYCCVVFVLVCRAPLAPCLYLILCGCGCACACACVTCLLLREKQEERQRVVDCALKSKLGAIVKAADKQVG